MTFLAFDMGNEAHAACVMFVTWIVEALNRRKSHLDDRPASKKEVPARESCRFERQKLRGMPP
ncbi:hypothetical protein [Novosphingobium sp. B1]|uniref:hypothetical protein n=1 Tax=Novosphingobium sp. B1 TaxID=1938756 RepID=UPI0020CAC1B6|nr:hypothetical protein [Novosphingobium sp. B1]